MPGQRQYHGKKVPLCGKASGYMHHGLQQADLFQDPLLAAQLIAPVVQPRLTLAQQAR
ncbi:hypothetical protein D3C86_1907840 [compost metagenome]